EQVVEHEHLTVGGGARADPDHRDLDLLHHDPGNRGGDRLEHDRETARLLQGDGGARDGHRPPRRAALGAGPARGPPRPQGPPAGIRPSTTAWARWTLVPPRSSLTASQPASLMNR